MKRIVSFVLAFFLSLGSCLCTSFAVEGTAMRASPTIVRQGAGMDPGQEAKELRITSEITATRPVTQMGVSSIVLYKSDGTYVTTITGTTDNGLVKTSGIKYAGTYSYKNAVSGQYYYAEVTLFATIGSVSDSVTITTDTVKAP